MKFIIEKKLHDFSFSLIESIDYQNWFRGGKSGVSYKLVTDVSKFIKEDVVPVGSIDFVNDFVSRKFGKTLIPRKINSFPKYLLNRNMTTNVAEACGYGSEVFVKDNENFKQLVGIYQTSSLEVLSHTREIVYSEVINILSEYRIFVHNYEIVGIKHYLGDVYKIPKMSYLKDVVDYIQDLDTYSFDVAVTVKGEALLEVHDIFSVGLYGFDERCIMPQMFNRGFRNALRYSSK